VIFVKGFNVFPREIEEVLISHASVSGACVVGREDERAGELPVAYVTLRSDVEMAELSAFCAEVLADYKLPSQIIAMDVGRFEAELEMVREFQPELVITALGGPHRVTDAVHSYGGLVFADVNSPKYAKKAIEKGADGLVLVCSGAGGHTGEYAMIPFIDEVRSFFDGPLIVGGGIGTGRAVKAVETLGVDFAYLGSSHLAPLPGLWAIGCGPVWRLRVLRLKTWARMPSSIFPKICMKGQKPGSMFGVQAKGWGVFRSVRVSLMWLRRCTKVTTLVS